MLNFRPGVDDDPADFMMLVKLNAPFDDRSKMIAVLQELQKVQSEKMNPERSFATTRAPDPMSDRSRKKGGSWPPTTS